MIRRIAAAVIIACSAFLAAIPATAQFADQATFATANGGTGTALTATIPNATSIADLKGVIIKIVPSTGNTGDTTLTVNGFGSPPHIYKPSPSGPVLLTGGELVALQPAWLMLDASGNFNLLSVTSTSFGAASITNSALSFGVPVNLQINASVGSNNLTIAVKGNNGSDPSATNPVLIPFRHSTIANGSPQIVSLQSALSFQINSGSTMGCVSGQMCRLWVLAICSTGLECTGSAGSDVVGLCAFNALNGTTIAPINEAALQTSQSGTNGGNSAQAYYCNISGVSSKAIRIIGYVDIQEASAGTWASGPTYTQLFGPGIKKPGDVIQTVITGTGAVGTGTVIVPNDDTIPQNTEGQQLLSQSIIPTSGANLLRCSFLIFGTDSNSNNLIASIFRDANPNALVAGIFNQTNNKVIPLSGSTTQLANSTASTTFNIRGGGDVAGTFTFNGSGGSQLMGGAMNSYIRIDEIMGALEPANDNEPLRAVG